MIFHKSEYYDILMTIIKIVYKYTISALIPIDHTGKTCYVFAHRSLFSSATKVGNG